MTQAIALGRRGLGRTAPNPSVGAILVSPEGYAVGRGWTDVGGRPHAEVHALARAGEAARGATLYVTLEPCSHHGRTPPCAHAVIAAGVARVVSAVGDPDSRVSGRGLAQLMEAGLAVTFGVGAVEARRLTIGHITRVTLGRPHVALKLAVSADGKVGSADRRPVAITGEETRARVHLMRAEADAIMVGIGTVLSDDPALTCRLPGMEDRSPIRIVMDSTLRTPLESCLVRTASETPTWIIGGVDAPDDAERALRAAGAEVMRVPLENGRPSVSETLHLLGARGVTRLMVEGGPTLAAALLNADLVDAAAIATAPTALGLDAVPAVEGLGLDQALSRFALVARTQLGADDWAEYERG
ncbi:bifunctional diaminohydroxyphosphoribosylaminopyrimidine deaminase/5-amino-6-(5-phosphoribosylamino)uracil reductase RibD [Hansschlegelia quercus]|uniref:Riboflavin biosynthesis protein RibD n=1 Tax=Hansschlegelia quercus TaxID=2528245 RepID=A0A4Q9GJH2_9HYPH|nr:bifunctional diaminohydroxyphosphoribosylaminopyrimidine deaminase/5-amino-6-(5-phosphoribosylamino)uracil reductase RibD [Hansschlegelia quercus]TBN54282.1 bifunctional diaminohydroxyphosphoribosylaminopyrimidine deaminase/5-amino-6-(5-phosphoribosylamino)uracil reductase RibD [Hansschlegelia quercus]